MKKDVFIKIFLFLVFFIKNYAISYIYDVDFYKMKISNNENIDKIEKIDYLEKSIILSGVEIKGVRVQKIETNFEKKTSEAIIMKDDMIEAFKRKNKDIRSIDCEFKNNSIRTKGKIILLGVLMDIEMEGSFYINENQELIYDIKSAVVNGVIQVPENIVKPIRDRINPVFKLKKLEIPLYMTTVIYGVDRLVLR